MNSKILNDNVLEKVAGGTGETNDLLDLKSGTQISFYRGGIPVEGIILEKEGTGIENGIPVAYYRVSFIDERGRELETPISSLEIQKLADIGG